VGDPIRRRILLSLARSGPQAACDLISRPGRTSTATLKHLAQMREVGLVIMKDNPNDGRKALYQLSLNIPLIKSE
jgi:DNA-binding transcriptional ArsR family regulator